MNFTRWSARFPGTQRRAAARTEHAAAQAKRGEGAVPAARGGRADPGTERPTPAADGHPADPTVSGTGTGTGDGSGTGTGSGTGPAGGTTTAQRTGVLTAVPSPDELSVREVLGRLPALVALVHGPEHRVAYVNDAYTAGFGARTPGAPAHETLPELGELGLLPLLDQVQRSGKSRTAKNRTAPGGAHSYTVTCTPVEFPKAKAKAKSDTHTEAGAGSAAEAHHTGILIHLADVTDHAEAVERLRASERRQREAAVTLQRSLLPQELEQPDDLRIAATYQPGGTEAAVGGDWYDVITLGAGRTALVIGDVMGRGVRAAAVMGQLRTAVRAYARLDLPPHEVLQLLDGLAAEIDASQIATCVYAVHDPNEGLLAYASAGHLPILVRDEDGTVRRAADPTGPPLGTGGWLHTSGTIALGPGSTAVLYTDGLVERRGEDIDEGVAALERALSGAQGTPAVICDRLMRALGVDADHDDDVAVMVLQQPARTGADAELFHNAALELLGGIEAAPRARAFAQGVLASWRFPVELCDLGVLAASELVANSLQHGTPPMRLRLRRTDRRLIIEVTDGDDHLPRRRRAEPGDETGRGISIIATIASSWGSRRTPGGGKAVWCEFALPDK
ncbi:serine/threonine-protein phosphatase [Streptomyces sp. MB09-01]|uniref:ATP-binding SpoIIE family protein phosphatase n=1 Tax=Streptomyces sp. MB09-01 TaxID=3028666 RepID=UPI0029BF8F1C|nr:ATP-binding SpoIIE family protein phosphatase [Streptomyces sp. MB09-01]MDX3540654.1 serine/threonine-protein phosphatase [Streptomyces sp. MB09-01]